MEVRGQSQELSPFFFDRISQGFTALASLELNKLTRYSEVHLPLLLNAGITKRYVPLCPAPPCLLKLGFFIDLQLTEAARLGA